MYLRCYLRGVPYQRRSTVPSWPRPDRARKRTRGVRETTATSRPLTCGNCPIVQDLHHLRGRQRDPAGDHRLRRRVPSRPWLPVLPRYLIEDGPPHREAGLLRRIEWSVRVPALWATESETGDEGDGGRAGIMKCQVKAQKPGGRSV